MAVTGGVYTRRALVLYFLSVFVDGIVRAPHHPPVGLMKVPALTRGYRGLSVFPMSDAASPFGIRVVRAGARLDHDQHYVVDRPHGTGDWLFVHFLTPIIYLDEQSERQLPTGTCVLYSPGRAQRYRPLPGMSCTPLHSNG